MPELNRISFAHTVKQTACHCKVLKREEQHIACKGKMNKVAQTLYHMAALTRFHRLLSSLVFPF